MEEAASDRPRRRMNGTYRGDVKISGEKLAILKFEIAFEYKTFFMALAMIMRCVNGSRLHADEHGTPFRNGIIIEDLKCHPWRHFLPYASASPPREPVGNESFLKGCLRVNGVQNIGEKVRLGTLLRG